MKYQNFEQNIKNQLYLDEAAVDMNALLTNLGLKKKKRRGLLLPILLAGTMLVSGLSIWYITNNASGNGTSNEVQFIHSNSNQVAENTPSPNTTKPIETNQLNQNHVTENDIRASHLKSLTVASHLTKNTRHLNKKPSATSISPSTFSPAESPGIRNDQNLIPTLDNDNEMKTNRYAEQYPNLASVSTKKISSTSTLSWPGLPKEVECPTFSKKSSLYFELIPEIGIFKPFKSLSEGGNEVSDVFSLRQNNETTKEGLQAGLFLRLRKSKSPLFFRTGLEYQQLTEKMNLNYSYITRDTTIGIISITVSQTGDTITVIRGPIVTETTHSGKNIAHHQFRTLDLPLTFGFEKSMGGFDLGVEAGLSLNLRLSSGGNILTSSNSYSKLSEANLFKSSLGINWLASVYAAKDFESIGRFYVALRGRYLPSPFNNDNNNIKQKYTYLGMHLGYIMTF